MSKKIFSCGKTATEKISEFEREFSLECVHAQLSFLEGEVLTIVDASYSNAYQNKAIKDLMKTSFRNRMNHFEDLCRVKVMKKLRKSK